MAYSANKEPTGLTAKTTPVDADVVVIGDSTDAVEVAKKTTWANIKATLKTYFDTLYQASGSYISSGGALGTPSSGTLTNCSGYPAATTTSSGIAEAAIASEVDTGTDTARYVSPDALAGSNFGIRYIQCQLNGASALTVSDKLYFRIPAAFTGMNLVSVTGTVGTGAAGASSSGVPTFTVKNVTDNNQMLTTSLTIDANEYTSATAATPVVINTSFDDVVTDDLIEVLATTTGTGVTYATVTLGFQLP